MEHALEQEQAAETLRSVEGMRRRTIAAVNRLSPMPPLIFGLATLVAAPFTLLTATEPIVRAPNVFVIGPDPGRHGVIPIIAIAVATIVAVVLTALHYRRQPVHPARPARKQMSAGEAIFLAVMLVLFGPGIVGFFLAFAPLHAGSGFIPFAALAVTALVMAKGVQNGALGVASVWGFVVTGLSPFLWTDHWETISALGFAGSFLLAALFVRYVQRRSA